MFAIQLAGVRIGMDNRYSFVEHQCKDYLCEARDLAFTVSASPEEIAKEQALGDYAADYCESICLYRHICELIPAHNVFLFHSCILEVDGYAYAFTAKSGVGKSTHCALWLKTVPNARVLNGDKPLIRVEEDGTLTAFGTPWNGKENWGENISAPLAAVCFIERGEINTIETVSEGEAVDRLIHQLYLRGPRQSVMKQLMLMDSFVRGVPFYLLHCNISKEAARLSFETMRKK
ncbi:MAG: hypothetical protein E7637_02705 [Ruminococcaceae bacterium]|nr:hypothetical protein [Oscillospiraceae bacterium]